MPRGYLRMDAEELARRFHDAYERLAPQYGYATRPETAVPWLAVPEQNKRLMIAVCEELLAQLCDSCAEQGSERSQGAARRPTDSRGR